MSLTIVDRYILREILQTWGAVTAVLLLILATNSLAYMLGKVVEGRLAADVVVPLVNEVRADLGELFDTEVGLGIAMGQARRSRAQGGHRLALGACGHRAGTLQSRRR